MYANVEVICRKFLMRNIFTRILSNFTNYTNSIFDVKKEIRVIRNPDTSGRVKPPFTFLFLSIC
jgi:hypothetical protein